MIRRFSLFIFAVVMASCNDGIVTENPNNPPVAEAGDNLTVAANEAIAFDGSGSYDTDGDVVAFEWDFDDGTMDETMSPTHTFTEAGTYTVILTVTDNDGATGKDQPVIVVEVTPYAGVYAVESNPASQPCGMSEIQFVSTNVTLEVDGSVITSDWDWDSTPSITVVQEPTGTLTGDDFTQSWVEEQNDSTSGFPITLTINNTWTGHFNGDGTFSSQLAQNITDNLMGMMSCRVTWPDVKGTRID